MGGEGVSEMSKRVFVFQELILWWAGGMNPTKNRRDQAGGVKRPWEHRHGERPGMQRVRGGQVRGRNSLPGPVNRAHGRCPVSSCWALYIHDIPSLNPQSYHIRKQIL